MPQIHREIQALLHDMIHIVPEFGKEEIKYLQASYNTHRYSCTYQTRNKVTSTKTRILDSLKDVYSSFNL